MTMKTTRGLNETTDKLVLIAEKRRVGTPGVKSTFIDADIHSMLMQIKEDTGIPITRLLREMVLFSVDHMIIEQPE